MKTIYMVSKGLTRNLSVTCMSINIYQDMLYKETKQELILHQEEGHELNDGIINHKGQVQTQNATVFRCFRRVTSQLFIAE